jgi:hypothetical protein
MTTPAELFALEKYLQEEHTLAEIAEFINLKPTQAAWQLRQLRQRGINVITLGEQHWQYKYIVKKN